MHAMTPDLSTFSTEAQADCGATLRVPAARPRRRRRACETPAIDASVSRYLLRPGLTESLFGLLLLLLSLPVIGILVLLVRLTSRGPGLFRQVRVGYLGRIFVMYKIRSMVIDAEVDTGPAWTQNHDDPRITRVGRFLRKSHLDELPQLINVVRGEMKLFGPRPERPELVGILAHQIPGYLNRLAVKPGITGLAQINLPPDTDLDSVRRKLKLDLEYIATASFALEVRMFVWTCLRLAAVPARVATQLMGVGRNVSGGGAAAETGPAQGPVTFDTILAAAKAGDASPHGNGHPASGTAPAENRRPATS
jgi:lipopolysaccharide/colanic/teichoic acid biosynthesis glycosyltransferase